MTKGLFVDQKTMFHHEQFLRQLMSQSADCIFFTDQDARLTMVSPPARQYFIDSPCWLEGTPVRRCISDTGLLQAYEDADAALSQGQASFHTLNPWGENEEQFALHFQGETVAEDDGTFLGCIFTFSIEKSSRQLEFEATMLINLMRNSEDLIYFKDLDSKFTCVSHSLVKRIGVRSVAEILGKSDFDFWDRACAEGFFNDEREIIRTRKPVIGKAELVARPDGTVMWGLSSKMPLIDENDNVVGIFGISKDITSQKETEQELEVTHKQLLDASRQAGMAEIATNVLHNVGNVLNSINVSILQTTETAQGLKIDNLKKIAVMLQDNADNSKFLTEDEKGKRIPEYLSLVSEELATDRNTINDELESTRGHVQHIKMIVSMQQEYATGSQVIEQVDLAKVLNDAIKMSSGSLERHRISLVREFEPGIQIMLDKHRVIQILVNLIRNAKHAVQDLDLDPRMIKVAVSQPNEETVTIKIIDNGIGISAENMVNLFNHGFSTKSKGHGFGLHSGANSAKDLGGSLTAHSDGPGKGSTFTLTLPIETVESNANPAAPILHADVETKMGILPALNNQPPVLIS